MNNDSIHSSSSISPNVITPYSTPSPTETEIADALKFDLKHTYDTYILPHPLYELISMAGDLGMRPTSFFEDHSYSARLQEHLWGVGFDERGNRLSFRRQDIPKSPEQEAWAPTLEYPPANSSTRFSLLFPGMRVGLTHTREGVMIISCLELAKTDALVIAAHIQYQQHGDSYLPQGMAYGRFLGDPSRTSVFLYALYQTHSCPKPSLDYAL